MLLEIVTIACTLTCKIQMSDGTIYEVPSIGSFKEGDFVQLSQDKKTLCRPMCPIVPSIPPQEPPAPEPTLKEDRMIRGLW